MAYDGYHSGSQPYEGSSNGNNNNPYGNFQQPLHNNYFQPPYPEYHDADPDRARVPFQQPPPPQQQQQPGVPPPPPPPGPYPPPSAPPEYPQDPSRFYQPHSSPIDRAATAAFHSTAAGSASDGSSAYLSPEVLSQITATVIQQLKGTNLETGGIPQQQQQQQQQQPQPPLSQSHPFQNQDLPPFPPSVSTQSDYSPSHPKVYTPPSPHKSPEDRMYSSPPPSSGGQGPSTSNNRANHQYSYSPEPERSPQPPHRSMERPRGPSRQLTAREESTMERIWGQFFDKDGKPTHRLGQLLRGIAVHLIENFPPGNTIVITPEKMQKYYEDSKVAGDNYPWMDIFDDRTSQISRLYRDVEAEHHLIQDHLDEKPDIPGLTQRGFERWMTLMIQAHPDQEFERLQITVLQMPINNPDDRRERFPKELPRRLFPKSDDQAIKGMLEQGITTHCKIKPSVFARENSPPPKTHRYRNSEAGASASTPSAPSPLGFDQRRKRYSATVEDEPEDTETPQPIERERQPYSVQPGGSRPYDESSSVSRGASPIDIPSSSYRDAGGQKDWNRSPADSMKDYRRAPDDHMATGSGDRGMYGSPIPTGSFPPDRDDRRYADTERRSRKGDHRFYDTPREPVPERDKRRYHERPSRVTWDNDEDFYRGTGLLGGKGGAHEPYDYDPPYSPRY